jgi:mannose-P-dolichol utilization defect protein 1
MHAFPPHRSLLIIAYSHAPSKSLKAVTFLGAMATASYALFSSSATSVETLRSLLALSIPLSLSSKLPQIATIWQTGSTGQLSAFLVFNSLAGTLARVFTTATETGDRTLWWAFVSASALNAVIAGQMLWYWRSGGSREGANANRSRTPLSQSASRATGKVAAAADRVSEKVQERAHSSQPVLGEPVAVSSSSSNVTSSNLAPSVAATPAKPASNVGVAPRSVPRSAGRSASTRYTRKVD